MTRNILWYQPPMLEENDIVVLNGKILPEGKECDKNFHDLKFFSDKCIKHKSPWCGKVEGLFFIKGHLDAQDEKGRLLPFMFVSDEKDGHQALLRELKVIGYEMTLNTKKCIKKQPSIPSIAIVVAVSVIIVVLLLIFAKYGD